eukprot:gene25575-32047_t
MAERKASHLLAFEAEKLANGTPDLALRVQATITSGQSYAEQGNFAAALGKLQIAVDLGRQLDDLVPLAQALNALALLYTQMKEYDKGWEVLDESVRVAEKLNSPGRLATAKGTEYGLAIDSHQPKRALAALQAGLEVARKMGAKTLIANTLVNLSDSYLKEHDFVRVSAEAGTRATALVNLGQAHLGLGHVAEGRKHFDAGLLYYEKTGDQPELQVILKEYGQALERAGDLRGAVSAYHRERAISEALFEQERQKAVYEMQEKYETEKKQRQIELLSRENQVKSAELDNRRLQQRVWWLLAVVFALASVIVGLLYRKVRHANAQLEVKNLELKAGVEEIARRILVSISSQQIAYQNHKFNVNVSVGFAPFPLVPADTALPWERAVNLVDMALYLAKAHGRNRAYGVRGFDRFHQTSMEAIEQDLERAWRAGFVELSVVLGGAPDIPPPPGEHSNVVPLKPAIKL